MKRPYGYEAAAAILGLIGAFLLGTGLTPFTNPGMVDAANTGDYSPRMQFLIPTLLSLPFLGAAWHFNTKARKITKALSQTRPAPAPEPKWQTRLKWVLFGIVVLFVLSAFL